jgi:hypothetical protein
MRARWAGLLLAGALAGCAGEPERTAGTGAEAAARAYFEALVRQDWPAAYGALTPENRKRVSAEQFAALAKHHRSRLGFTPEKVAVKSCEERGAEAIAHVVLTGRAGARQRFYKDAVTLRRGANGWGVVLPPRFGREW